jgi:hypothetical protein
LGVKFTLVTSSCIFVQYVCKADRIEKIRRGESEKDLSTGGKPEEALETPPVLQETGRGGLGTLIHFLQGSTAILS